MTEARRSIRKSRPCAILVASNAPWAPEAERIIRAHGYAVARLADLHYADLVVGPADLKVVVVASALHDPTMASHTARLRSKNADLLVIVLGGGARQLRPTAAGGDHSVYLPDPFDADRLHRVLPPVEPDRPA